MNHLPKGLKTKLATSVATLTLLTGAVLLAFSPTATAAGEAPIKFGMESSSVSMQAAAGVKPDYGTFWIGPWTLSSGWAGPDSQLTNMKNAGVTPAVHFYYWGDDISPSCVEYGCYSDLHNSYKNRAGWDKLGTQLTDHLKARMGGAPVVIFLESEFNKGGISTYEPFDGYLEAMAKKIHAAYPNAIIVLGFGNWGSASWGTFNRAAAESDMVGIQGMRGSTRQSKDGMLNLYEGLLAGVKTLRAKFPGKDIMLTDLAVSSYPEPEYLNVQRDVMKEVLDNRATLKSLGVKAIIYRSWKDSPGMDLANYYGQAERHWGVAWASNGALKPVAYEWIKAVKAERAGTSPTATTTTTTTSPVTKAYSATFTLRSASNEWWVQEGVSSSPAPVKVELKVNGGAWQAMKHESYGDWTLSKHVTKGSQVAFRATAPDGQTATSATQSYLGAAATTSTTTAFKATFTPKAVGNDWWVETAVSGNAPLAKVEAKVGSGSYVTLAKQDWGTYAKSMPAGDGVKVTFRATSTSGAVVYGPTVTWT